MYIAAFCLFTDPTDTNSAVLILMFNSSYTCRYWHLLELYKCLRNLFRQLWKEQSTVHVQTIIRDLSHNVLSLLILICGSLYYQIIQETLNFLVVILKYEYNVSEHICVL